LSDDEDRTHRLNADGYDVVRYLNVEIYDNLESVLHDLGKRCEARRTL